jgi:hypothetical protein
MTEDDQAVQVIRLSAVAVAHKLRNLTLFQCLELVNDTD